MVYNLISCKTVVAKVYADLQLKEENVEISDMIEWCGEALNKIGAFSAMRSKVTGMEGIPLLEISNYQARLPFDFHKLIQVAYTDDATSENFYPMKYATGSFEGRSWLTKDRTSYTAEDSTLGTVIGTTDLVQYTMELFDETWDEAVERLNLDPVYKSNLENLLGNYEDYRRGVGVTNRYQLEYKIVPGYIKTNVEEGYLMVAYQSMPIDEEGYPMIPDDESFKEAIFWYINMKLTYIEWRTKQTTKDVYYDAKNTWNFYVKQAYGNAVMPSTADEMESVRAAWNRLLPQVNAHKNFFKFLDTEEMIKTHN